MRLCTEFNLALELSNTFPNRTVVESAATQLLIFARELRKSGSDIVVEEDLATVFGRGRISPELAEKFRDAVEVQQTSVPLTREGEIRLNSGPGPTMHRALKERLYFATVVQLFLLAWMQPREKLAAMLATCMTKRLEMGVQDASNPGYEGIVETLAACSARSSSFAWSFYVQQVEAKLRSCMPDYRFHNDYVGLSDTLLLGAMDYLYIVQSLPDRRRILVSNQKGCLTLIVLAHYVLGLTVAVASGRIPDKNVLFGDSGSPQVIISWQECEDLPEDINHNDIGACRRQEPEIQLLNQDMSVYLQSSPEEQGSSHNDIRDLHDRHPLLGYGTASLHRTYDIGHSTPDSDPFYRDSVNLATALAVHVSSRLVRTLEPAFQGGHDFGSPPRYEIQLEAWRVLASSKIIFAGIGHDPAAVNYYVEALSDSSLSVHIVSNSFASFLKKVTVGNVSFLEAKDLFTPLRYLARVVLLFAFAIDVESCAKMPILLNPCFLEMTHALDWICRTPNTRAEIEPGSIFNGIIRLLSLDTPSQELFLWSDFGWSVFLGTTLDKDPAEVKPHLIHIQRGVPTNRWTNESKRCIADRSSTLPFNHFRTTWESPGETESGVGRTIAQVTRRSEHWTSRALQFEMDIILTFEPVPHSVSGCFDLPPGKARMTCQRMHHHIWGTFLTPGCAHEPEPIPKNPREIGSDAVALLGWTHVGDFPQRIVIILTQGDPSLRWLVVGKAAAYKRGGMLRTRDCCAKCALEHVSSLPGRWILIL